MSDNVQVTPGVGKIIATDEVTDATLGTVQVQYVKIMDGDLDGTSKATVGANGLKTDGSGVTQPISAVSLPLPAGAATSANQTTELSSLSSIDTKLTTTNSSLSSIDAGIPTALGQTTMVNSLAVTIASDQSPLNVTLSGTNTVALDAASLNALENITATLDTTSLNALESITVQNGAGASAVNIQDGGNSITVDGPLTDAQLRATAVPVSMASLPALPAGTNVIGHVITDSGSTTVVSNFPSTQAVTQSGTWNVNNISGTVSLPTGAATEATQLSVKADLDEIALDTDNLTGIKTDLDKFTFSSTKLLVDGSGTTQPVSITTLPAGTNVIGHVIADSGSTTVVTGNVTVVQPTGTNLHVVIDSLPEVEIKNDSGNTLPVSGTVTANAGTGTFAISATSLPLPSGAATAALQTQPGVDIGDVTVNNATGGSAVNIQDGGNSITVDGTITANIGTTNGLLLDNTFTGRINTQGQKAMTASTPVVLASDQSAIPVKNQDGSGNALSSTGGSLNVNITGGAAAATEQHTVDSAGDTYVTGTTKGILAEARVIDVNSPPTLNIGRFSGITVDTYGNLNIRNAVSDTPSAATASDYVALNKVFSLSVNVNQATSGTNNPLLLIKNPIGSGVVLYLYRVQLGVNVANVTSNFLISADPTVTANGTPVSSTSNNVGGGSPASAMESYSLPTISSIGTQRLATYTYGQNSNSIDSLQDFSIHVAAGHSVLLTGNPTSNNRQAALTLTWVEV